MVQASLSLASLGVAVLCLLVGANGSVDRSVRIRNDSGVRVEVHWVHPITQQTSLMSAPHVSDGATFPLDTYVGHSFQLREVPHEVTGESESNDQTCRVATFNVTEDEDQGRS